MKVLVALSGGVDSSVAAVLLQRAGHDLVGLTMKNWCYGEGEGEGRSCCSLESIEAARAVADRLGFPHYVADFETAFTTHVIRPFVSHYVEGRTPNPCVACNAKVRFPGLWNRARAFGCEAFATGHYARVDRDSDPPAVRRPRDPEKDQSYVLWGVPEEALRHFHTPLGRLTKAEVRAIAAEEGLAVAGRPDSQEICFVPDGDYGAFLDASFRERREEAPATLRAGPIVTRSGRRLGTHRGVARYTIGQRRGLGVAAGEPVYVLELDPATNRVIVGGAEDLLVSRARLRAVRWPSARAGAEEVRLHVQLRSRHRAALARIVRDGSEGATVEFEEAQRAVTPGQSAVFYDGDRVVGGGVVADPHQG